MTHKPTFSFEFFPPRDEVGATRAWEALTFLAKFAPSFVSITYGAGGTTRANTHGLVSRVVKETELQIAAHLTCVGQTQQELLEITENYWQLGVRHLVLLRGDMPEMGAYHQHAEGFNSTPEFISAVRAQHSFEVSVSAYPEKHPESVSFDHDLDLLRQKQEAGAVRAVSQFYFDDEAFLRLRDKAAAYGITLPIVPGIIQTTNFKGIQTMAQKSGASVPAQLVEAYAKAGESLPSRQAAALDIARTQCDTLLRHGVEHFHFYTLNQKKITAAVCSHILSA